MCQDDTEGAQMKKRFTEEQIIKIIQRYNSGSKTKDLCREFGVSTQTFYSWKKKYANMTVDEAKKLKALEHENLRLKKLIAEQALSIEILKEVNSKKW
jgi:putative transposase